MKGNNTTIVISITFNKEASYRSIKKYLLKFPDPQKNMTFPNYIFTITKKNNSNREQISK